MEVNDVKVKIKKLFAMADPNSGASQGEVESAIVMARKLMIKYKLSEADVFEEAKKKLEVISKSFSDITYSTQTNPWIDTLNSVIADNYCCHACQYTVRGAKTRSAGLIGFKEDVEMAGTVLKYAVNSVLHEGNKIRNREMHRGASYSDTTAMINALGNGFVQGLRERFEEQNEAEKAESASFAMIMVTPHEVNDYIKNNCKTKSFDTSNAKYKARQYDDLAVKGYHMGKDFSMHDKLSS